MEEKKEINIIVGQNIKREREKAGYTQEQFSEMIGIGPKSLSAIERGTVGISLPLLLRVVKLLGITTDSILLTNRNMNDIDDFAERLQKLPQRQFVLVRDIVYKVLALFGENDN